MTIFRTAFAGQIKKIEHKQAGDSPLCEVSLCKKQKGRAGAEDTFCWIRITIWKPTDFQLAALAKGAFIAGSGEMSTRSFTDKDGKNQVSIEVKCTSFDIEVSAATETESVSPLAAYSKAPTRPTQGASASYDQPPFARSDLEL